MNESGFDLGLELRGGAAALDLPHVDDVPLAEVLNSVMKPRMSSRPRPQGRSMFSIAVGSGTSSGLKPGPSSVMPDVEALGSNRVAR